VVVWCPVTTKEQAAAEERGDPFPVERRRSRPEVDREEYGVEYPPRQLGGMRVGLARQSAPAELTAAATWSHDSTNKILFSQKTLALGGRVQIYSPDLSSKKPPQLVRG
jgi:hypothetical protein